MDFNIVECLDIKGQSKYSYKHALSNLIQQIRNKWVLNDIFIYTNDKNQYRLIVDDDDDVYVCSLASMIKEDIYFVGIKEFTKMYEDYSNKQKIPLE